MKTDKAREFWITKNDNGEPTHIALFEKLNDREQIHVIEYTAYEQLEQKVKELESQHNDYARDIAYQFSVTEMLEQKLAAQEREVEKYKNANARVVDAAYHALLEMSAWLGINQSKRMSYIEELMSNVRFCADIANQQLTKVK
jgi:hypothetical protein